MTTPLTIRKPETLDNALQRLIDQATAATSNGSDRGTAEARINKQSITCQVTPKVSNGTFYVLFYRDGKRTSRNRLHQELGVSVPA